MHLHLSLYKDMLKNIPLGSAEDYQTFLNMTSPSYLSNGTNQAPLSSTFTETGTGHPQGFWKNLSFARKSMKATTVRTQKANAKETCSVEMGSLLQKQSRQKIKSKSEPSLPNPNSLVNERPLIGTENDPLDTIETAPETDATE